ncbi:Fe(3+)-hydroxamate ABC transporter permease FhuB [Thalassospira marina]|uniref:Fe(3+)-hydroxamate ABC transporter permease FhuB n=1 Tax=Thalassospira marina TaxID=2048283 RepID=A0ABM6QBF0_9PROT|nr:Fe(3+)-hydroxamate ABC transporter permease FhuB [Thalassospira marina]AUG53885.1 Fe(3+)-hydroxamate ABC transporter permease FhuB [Thalassospira marina]
MTFNRISLSAGTLLVGLTIGAVLLVCINAQQLLPIQDWSQILQVQTARTTQASLFVFSFLPRTIMAFLVGGALALSGAILQQTLRNQLAEPSTLGISAGAHLALSAAIIWFPGLLVLGREWVALAGACGAAAAVFALGWRQALSPVTVILAGLMVSLYCGAMAATITLFNHDLLIGLFFWGAGHLDQQNWNQVVFLGPRILIVLLVALVLVRPLNLLVQDDATAKSLGLSVVTMRLLTLGIAILATALATSAAGVFGFVGLAGPAIIRALNIRRMTHYLLLSTLAGGILLLITDQLILLLPTTYRLFPTGAATALLGAPLLLYLLPRLKASASPNPQISHIGKRIRHPATMLVLAFLAVLVLFSISLMVDKTGDQWQFASSFPVANIMEWRLPRAIGALAAGAILAITGCILQRTTGNPIASPEVLGISSGAIAGVVILMFCVETVTRGMQITAGGIGAILVLLLLITLSRRGGFSGDRLLLAGVALSSVTGLMMAVLMTAQDPRLGQLLSWLSGSTYYLTLPEALLTAGFAAIALAISMMTLRWLDMVPLGTTAIFSLGVPIARMRYILFVSTAILTAGATLIIGPLSFVGLMGPHMANMAGFHRARHQIPAAALFGGGILLLADWLGRNLIFPFQIPAGLATNLIGVPFLLWLLARKRAQ